MSSGTLPAASSGASETGALVDRLRSRVKGDVRFDRLSRTLYATDASIYEITPAGVVMPKDVDDVVAVVCACGDAGTPVIARGAGTGLTGGAVGHGVQLDLSRYMNAIGPVDVEQRTVEVQPGVVLDEVNAHLAQYGLQFAPDVATASRATIGGMIANNSCGAHSIVYGRTVDHVHALTVVLADGEVVTFERGKSATVDGRAGSIARHLAEIRDEHADEIERRFPKVLRSNGGYGLDRLGSRGQPIDVTKLICGSEGTLGIVVAATIGLIPPPKHTGLAILHFESLLDALTATPAILKHEVSAVELVDHLIVDAARSNPALASRSGFIEGRPAALLIVEFFDKSEQTVAARIDRLVEDKEATAKAYASSAILDLKEQSDVWNLRTCGLGLLMSKPGDAQPYAFVEDSAVDPLRLADYIERFGQILDREGVTAGYYAHASVGCIHVRPVLNLKKANDVEKMRRIAESISDLALEFGGAMTGEHGDGIVRSCWSEKMYGPQITRAFRQVKELFDPAGIMNPHKIVDPWPMTEHLRYGPDYQARTIKTYFDYGEHGGPAGLVAMCSGVGQCRQRQTGVMCPSFVATNDEKHTTRARANALRVALSNRGLLDGLDDPQLAEVMDLCLSCKACKTECPTGVDMARLKAEYLAHRVLSHGASRRARLICDLPDHLARASRFPRIANIIARSRIVRAMMERRFGLDRRIMPPKLATQTFRSWFRRHRKKATGQGTLHESRKPNGKVVYFVDTWTNYLTPQVGIAAVKLLEHAGYEVLCLGTRCCGRTAISQGMLGEAKQLAEFNVRRLAYLAARGVPIVGTEPSCILTFVDEYHDLLSTPTARLVASRVRTIETFLQNEMEKHPDRLTFKRSAEPMLYHAHCHQKAILGSDGAIDLLARVFGDGASEIDSGCCGMAGSFGHEVEHYDVAATIGEERLFPAVRRRGAAHVATSGFSCRQQIEHHTGVKARHVV